MKVIFVTREGFRLPGARIRSYNFARALKQNGIDTEVFSYADHQGAKDGEDESSMGLAERIRFNWLAFKKLSSHAKEDIFCIQRFNYHAFAPYVTHLVRKNRIVLDLDDWEMRENPKYHFGFYPSSKAHYLTAQIAKKSIFCISASRFLTGFLSQFNGKVHYIPTGVDTELFKPVPERCTDRKIVFSWIGTFHKKEYIENIAFALDCFAALRKKYPDIYFEIAGDGIYKRDLVSLLRQQQNVRLVDWIEPEKVPEYLNCIDIGLLPVAKDTKFNRAKSPTKLFEYMAMKKPTVSSRIGEAANIIQEGKSGFLAATKDEFVEKMRILVEDRSIRNCMGNNAREAVEKEYSLSVLGDRLAKIFSTYNA